ncbi:protein BIG GRAIN 1-like B [Vicia villosa]|uniref:protein BIG GRAIN 1-like B n=1 Tax=Vicia villosa TaxID=3911 RepID=UPI00273B905B|nr:protein BIG GRAIN 1-like B [Vicia villosa]
MYKFENTRREKRFQFHSQAEIETPSFSSIVLDKIYRSIDEEERKSSDKKFYTETTVNRMSKINAKCNRFHQEEQNQRKLHHDCDRDQDVMFFSSTSSSSDSSSGLLSSSSDTESMYREKSQNSCFAHSKPKPVKIGVPPKRSIAKDEDTFIKSKSRAMKLYNNLKKVKQPISPGGKLTSFLNSLFINTKKTKTDVNAERTCKPGQTSTCSSASSFSRSCLSKNSSTSRDKSRNGAKRTVRFCPVSVIVDEDNRPCGNKFLNGEEDSGLTALSVPTAWKIGQTVSKKKEQEVSNMNKRVGDVLREFHLNRKLMRDFSTRKNEKDDDDVASCSSSDLFELDHLALIGNDKYYSEDLPVFETTHVRSNRAIRIV